MSVLKLKASDSKVAKFSETAEGNTPYVPSKRGEGDLPATRRGSKKHTKKWCERWCASSLPKGQQVDSVKSEQETRRTKVPSLPHVPLSVFGGNLAGWPAL
uniref:ARHGEF7 n=1 Tax=Syphacia muris TaxID=451379 RepID=A0A0N5AX55_9BILA